MRGASIFILACGLVIAGPTHAQTAAAKSDVPVVSPIAQALREGRAANSLGKFAEAEEAFRRALELQTGAADKANDADVGATLLELALNVSNQGRTDEAAALFRRVEPLLAAQADAAPRARLATYLALDASNRSDFVTAARYAHDAVAQWNALSTDLLANDVSAAGSSNARVAAVAESELANALNLQARLDLRNDAILPAYGAASQALLILNKSTVAPRWWKADSLLALGEVSVAQRRLSAAETYFQAALKIRRQQFGDGIPTIRVLLALGRAYQNEGLNSSAIITYREVFRLARMLPSTSGVFTPEMLVPFAAAITATAEGLTDPKQRAGLFAEGFDAFQLVQSPVVDKTIAQASARLAAANPAIATLIGGLQDHQREADLSRSKLAYLQSQPDGERVPAEEARLQATSTTALAAVAAARQALSAQFPDYERLATSKPIQLDQIRSLLRPREALVSFLIGHDRSFVQLVTRDGVQIAAVPDGEAALHTTVLGLRRALEIQGGAITEFNIGESNRLYEDLIGGLKAGLAGVDHLVIVPTGPLSNLPFGLLVTSPTTEGNYGAAKWLIRSQTIAYTPSLPSFAQLRTAKATVAARKPVLGFGDPILDGHVATKGEVTPMAQLTGICRQAGPMPPGLLRALAPLPDTARELNAVARSLGAPTDSLFMEGRATEANLYRQNLSDYRVLYFATHGLLPGELRCQAEPGLVLTPPTIAATVKADDGLLETSEIAGLRLNADLVVLSACNTAAGDGRAGGGDALSGLAEAFFYAGARNMVVSHWQVPSAATMQLMTGMFRAWGTPGGENVGDALRQSQLALVSDPKTAHPFFWAAFVTVGDGLGAGQAVAKATNIATGGAAKS